MNYRINTSQKGLGKSARSAYPTRYTPYSIPMQCLTASIVQFVCYGVGGMLHKDVDACLGLRKERVDTTFSTPCFAELSRSIHVTGLISFTYIVVLCQFRDNDYSIIVIEFFRKHFLKLLLTFEKARNPVVAPPHCLVQCRRGQILVTAPYRTGRSLLITNRHCFHTLVATRAVLVCYLDLPVPTSPARLPACSRSGRRICLIYI
jgi:hypothetical protein